MMPEKKPEENSEEWMTTYSDMVTLLMCFFVMLLAASKVDVVMFEQIRSGIAREFMDRQVDQPIALLITDLNDDIKTLKLDSDALLAHDHLGVVLNLNDSTLFDSGSATLKPTAVPILKKIVSTLKATRYNLFRFEVQGHTDDNPIHTQQFPSNWELSSARASAVTRFLIDNGIDSTRLRAVGMSDIQPLYPNRDPYGNPIQQNQDRNRRVVIRMDPVYK